MITFLSYIDPGSGSMVVQVAMGVVLGAGYAARQHIANFVSKVRGRRPAEPPVRTDQE